MQFCLNKVSKKRKKPFVKLDMYEMKTWLLVHLDVIILKWKLGNWVILFFSGQKPCFRIISSILHPFLTLFEGYKSYKLYEITPNKRFFWEPEKTNFKSFKFHKMKSYAWWFYLCFLNSCEIWNLFSRVSIRNCLWRYYRWLIISIQGHPTAIFGKISVRKAIWEPEFSEHLL